MSVEPTATPTQRAGFSHAGLIYSADEELLAVALPFLREGAAAGEPTLLAGNAQRTRGIVARARRPTDPER